MIRKLLHKKVKLLIQKKVSKESTPENKVRRGRILFSPASDSVEFCYTQKQQESCTHSAVTQSCTSSEQIKLQTWGKESPCPVLPPAPANLQACSLQGSDSRLFTYTLSLDSEHNSIIGWKPRLKLLIQCHEESKQQKQNLELIPKPTLSFITEQLRIHQ